MTFFRETDSGHSDYHEFIFAGLILLCSIFFLSGIFSIPLMPPDEPKYAFAAVKMIESGDFITPYFNCQPRFDKPPLFYWCIVLSFKIFGVNDWSARIPSILATLGTALALYTYVRRKFDNWTAVLSVIVFACQIHVWIMGRAVAPEMLLVFFEVVAIFTFSRGMEEGKKRYIYLGYASCSLAFLTKGPIGILIPWTVVFLYYWYKKGIAYTVKKLLDPVGIILFLVLGLPWYIVMINRHGYAYFQEFFLYHNVYRFTGQARQHPFHFYYYIPVLVGSAYLWLPFSKEIWTHLKKVYQDRSEEIFFVIWTLFVFVFFSVSVNKLHNYILIAYPPLAVLIGSSIRNMTFHRERLRHIYIGVFICEILGFFYAAFFMKAVSSAVLLGGFVIITVSGFIIFHGRSLERTLAMIVTKGLAILLLINLFMAGYESRIRPASALVLLEVMFEKSPIYFYKVESEDIVFYANRCITKLSTPEEVEKERRQFGEIVLFTDEKDLHELDELGLDLVVPFDDIEGRKRYLVEIEK